MYIPSLFQPVYTNTGNFHSIQPINSSVASPPKRQILSNLNDYSCETIIHSSGTEFSEMHVIEISRGCPRSCRFCLIHECYKPYRHRSINHILQNVENAPQNHRIGLLGAAAADHPELKEICNRILALGRTFSFSSLHASMIDEPLAELIINSGLKSVSIAPEAGLEQRRLKIGKYFTDEHLFNAFRLIGKDPIKQIKLYFIIGLPGETLADIESIPNLCKRLSHELRIINRSNRNIPRISVTISSFIPKALTPFERAPMMEEPELMRRLDHLQRMFTHTKEIQFTRDAPKWAIIQGLISRGDRRLADILESVVLEQQNWRSAMRTSLINPGYILHRKRLLNESLPWDHVRNAEFANSTQQ
jgi:radical SAM superfamily enzyme YgiQ (UPF0313 family)